MNPAKPKYLGRCDELPGDAAPLLWAFNETRTPLPYSEFAQRVGPVVIRRLVKQYGPLADNFTIKCFGGHYDGRETICLMHSGYHHLWAVGQKVGEAETAPLPTLPDNRVRSSPKA